MTTHPTLLIDAGTGNLHSVHNALLNLGAAIQVTSDPADLLRPARIILPGVGAFGKFMEGLHARALTEALRTAAQRGDPLLGICVGMQALFAYSEELGNYPGLGLMPGNVVRFPAFSDRKVPHTGWNQLWFDDDAALLRGLPNGAYAYFNHSYYCAPSQPADVAVTTDYGLDFASAVRHENLYGVQFHPEKSQQIGQKVLENFLSL